jgi:hypothetical protein
MTLPLREPLFWIFSPGAGVRHHNNYRRPVEGSDLIYSLLTQIASDI